MKKAEIEQAINDFHARIDAERAKGSTGCNGKWVDFHARHYLMAHGVSSLDDVRCRAVDKTDFRLFYDGRYHDGESKTGCGSWHFNKPDWTEDDIYPDKELFVIAIETDFMTEDNFMDLCWVATREQYIEMHRYTGKNGISSSLHYDAKHELMKIQPYVTKVTDPKTGKVRYATARREKFYDFIEENELPTLKEFREMIRER